MNSNESPQATHLEEEVTPSVRASEELVRAVARLKLRLEVCLRREQTAGDYRDVIAQCLADVDDVARAALVAGRSVE